MLKKILTYISFLFLSLNNCIIAYADEYRLDKDLLRSIIYFLQIGSAVVLVLGILMMVLSSIDENAASRVTALKWIGVSIFLLASGQMAKAMGIV